MTFHIVLTITLAFMVLFSSASLYLYYLGAYRNNLMIKSVLEKRSTWFFFFDFLIICLCFIGFVCVLL